MHRTEYRHRLRLALKEYDLSLLAYSITSNHTHLLINSGTTEALSSMMQKLEGEFAEYYNLRKKRTGAFWNGRYHATMIDGGRYLWNCMKYIDLNMVRAGVVSHPDQWTWCGHDELIGKRKRYRLLDMARVQELLCGCESGDFVADYQSAVGQDIERRQFARDPVWTESIAVGSESFVSDIATQTWNREELNQSENPGVGWVLRETGDAYTTAPLSDTQ